MKLCPECSNLCRVDATACDCGHAFPQPAPQDGTRSRAINRQFLGSFLSVCTGWLTLALVVTVYGFFAQRSLELTALVLTFGGVLLATSFFVFATWLLLFVPIYLFVPGRSDLWLWPICTLCGTVAGAVVMCWLGAVGLIGGAIVGGVTCLFASLTRRRFQPEGSAWK